MKVLGGGVGYQSDGVHGGALGSSVDQRGLAVPRTGLKLQPIIRENLHPNS